MFTLNYQLEVLPEYKGFIDCIYKIRVNYKLVDGEYEASDVIVISLPLPSQEDSYIAFSSLTDQKVREWISRFISEKALYKMLEDKIMLMRTPTVIKELTPIGIDPASEI